MQRIGLSLLTASAFTCMAQQPPLRAPEQDPAQRLLQEQRERLREAEAARPPAAIGNAGTADIHDLSVDPQSVADEAPLFTINDIAVSGNTRLSASEIERIVHPFRGIELGKVRINMLIRRLTGAYVSRGYVTTRCYLAPQNLAGGRLEVKVVEGVLERIERETPNGPQSLDSGTRRVFPLNDGRVLSLQDLEQGVEQLNRLRVNRAELEIRPGQSPGGSSVLLRGVDAPRWYSRLFMNAGFDNAGSELSGRRRARLGVTEEGLLGFHEAVSASYSGSADSNALVFSASAPWGYNTFSATFAYSEYQNLLGESAVLFGDSVAATVGWNRVLARGRWGTTALDSTLTTRRARRIINDFPLSPQRFTVGRIALAQMQRLPTGYVTAEIGYSRGFDAWRATQDPDGLPLDAAHAQFNKADATVSVVSRLPGRFGYRGGLAAQFVNRGLFSSEQIFVGGAASVRALPEGAVSGDRGMYTQHEVRYQGIPELPWRNVRTEPFLGVDHGRAQLLASKVWVPLTGWVTGVRMQGRGISGEFTYGRAVTAPSTITERSRFLASVSFQF